MAATGKTPILLYGSTTATNTPSAGNLTNSSDGCEIAINVADKNLFFKDSTNVVNTVPIRQSGTSSNGWLSSTDWTTFNNKQAALVSGTNIKTVGGVSLLGSGDVGTVGVGYGGTGTATTFTAGSVVFAGASGVYTQDNANLFWNDSSNRLGINNAAPAYPLDVTGQSRSTTGWAVSTDGSAFTPSGLNAIPNYGVGYITSTSTTTLTGFGGISFYTSQAERVRFFQSGGVSIGNTTDPGATNLSVSGNVVIATSGKGITDSTGTLTSTYTSTGITTNGTNSAGQVYRAGTYTAGTTTPSVAGISYMVIANSSPTSITNLTNGVTGQIVTLQFSDANTTITRNNAYLSGGVNFVSTANDTLTLINNAGLWYEVARGINA